MVKVIFWEYLQNLPIFAGFIWAFDLWKQDKVGLALLCMAGGSLVGGLLIALTESRKVPGHREPSAVLIANILGIASIMLIMTAYLNARWSGWLTDLLLGAVAGTGLAIVQSLAARTKISTLHCLALGLASMLALVGIRLLLGLGWPVWWNVLMITLLATIIIALIDYAPLKMRFNRKA